MLKTQKYFSALECGICKFRGKCRYKGCSEELYNKGFQVPVSECRRLQKPTANAKHG